MQNKQHKIDFIIEKCGGDSLSHVLDALRLAEYPDEIFEASMAFYEGQLLFTAEIFGDYQQPYFEEFNWQLLTNNKEAKLQDQSPETLDAIYKLLGGEDTK